MAEINVLCVKPKGKIVYNKDLFYLDKGKCYSDNWNVLGALQGEWYRIYSRLNYNKNDFVCGAYDIIKGLPACEIADYCKYILLDDFDMQFKQDNPGNMVEYVKFISDEIRTEFCKLLNNILDVSKIKTIMVLFREPLDPPEKLVGCITLNKFNELLNNNQIYENLAYIIKKRDVNEKYWEL